MLFKPSDEGKCRICGQLDCCNEMCDSTPPPSLESVSSEGDALFSPIDYDEGGEPLDVT